MHAAAGPTWPGTNSAVRAIRFNIAGDLALAALDDGSCAVLDPKTGMIRQQWQTGRKQKLEGLEISVDDKRVALQHAGDGSVYVCALSDGTLLHTISNPADKITAFALGADPRLLAVGTEKGFLQIHDLDNGKKLQELALPDGDSRVTAIAFSTDCQRLFVAHESATNIEVFQLPDLSFETSIPQPCATPIRLVASWDGQFLMVLSPDKVAQLILLQPLPNSKSSQLFGRYGAAAIHHGAPQNWFLLPATYRLCCYLGQEAFEHYNLYDGCVAGSQSTEQAPISEVALSGDGSQAATGLPDGTVHFYTLPGSGKTAVMRKAELNRKFRELLAAQQFDELEERAQQALVDTKPDTTGWSPAAIMQHALATLSTAPSAEAWEAHLAKLQPWLEAKPNSRAARFVLGSARKNYGWFLRGNATATHTSEQAFKGFFEQLQKADALLEAADKESPSAPICEDWITVSMGLQKDKGQLMALWERGIKDAPGYLPLHRTMTNALLPRWGGDAGAVGQLANRALQELRGEDRHLAYASIAILFLQFELPIQMVVAGFDLDVLEEATQTLIRRCPEAWDVRDLATIVACVRGDRAATADRISQSADRHDRLMWKNQTFDKFRDWAHRKPLPTDAESSLLASWYAQRQVAFADDADELITLSDDFTGQLHSWDLHDQLRQSASVLPDIRPWFMSGHARWIIGQRGQQPQVAIFDRSTGRSSLRRDIDPQQWLCISDNEQQLAGYIQGNSENIINIYDLAKTHGEPTHSVKLDETPVAVAFTAEATAPELVVADGKRNLRLLSQEGQALRPPVTLPRVAQRLASIPGGSRMLVAGEGLLVVVDFANGSLQKLSDEATDGAHTSYSSLAVSRDGTLAAAARIDATSPKNSQSFQIELWDLVQGRQVRVLAGHENRIESMSFSSDGKRLASGEAQGFVRIWNLESRPQ